MIINGNETAKYTVIATLRIYQRNSTFIDQSDWPKK